MKVRSLSVLGDCYLTQIFYSNPINVVMIVDCRAGWFVWLAMYGGI